MTPDTLLTPLFLTSRSSLDYNLELAHDVTQELPKVMLSRFLGANCIGFDDTHTTLIMPREIPTIDPDKTDLRTLRLIEKMEEAIKDKKAENKGVSDGLNIWQ